MVIDRERRPRVPRALTVFAVAVTRFIIAAFMALHASPARAQAADEVIRPWDCLTNSSAAISGFGAFGTPPGCTIPGVTWSGPSPARAIVPPGTPGRLEASVIGRTVVLKWTAPTTGGTPTSYIVQAGSARGQANLVDADTESPLPTLTATDVPDGTYVFRVRARSESGTSTASNEVSVRVGLTVRISASDVGRDPVCTVPPASTALTAIRSDNQTVTFVWRAGEGDCQAFALPDYYTLDYGTSPGATAGALRVPNQPTSVNVPIGGVSAGIYYVRVRGWNGFGASPPSNEVILRIGGVCGQAPLTPTNLAATVAGGTVVFTWDEVSPFTDTPTGYRFQGGVESRRSLAQWGVTGTTFRLNGVPAGSYYFWVAGVNACGSSPDSSEILVTVGGPAVPVVVTPVHQFAGAPSDGANFSTLMLGRDGNFYGTSVSGGPVNSRCVANLQGCGVAFKLTPSGVLTVLTNFGSSSPVYPYSRLVQSSDGNFWGTTTGQESGNGAASVFRMTSGGSNSFITELGGPSYGALIQGTDGAMYGTTIDNGPGTCSWRSTQCTPSAGSGTIFKVTDGGTLTYLHTFNGSDGSKPYAGLLQASDGMLWGTTSAGGAYGYGTIFKMTTGGTFTTVYSFRGGTDGANPAYSALMRASDGNFYGTTQFGGGTVNAGTIFKMTPAGALTILHAFTGVLVRTGEPLPTTAMDGLQPGAGLVEATDGKLYGVAGGGGGFAGGTVFNVTKDGTYTQLYAFDGGSAGGSPTATLVLGPDGNLWGTAQYGGFYNRGTVFKMTLPR